jgi:hypothetical protein
MMIILYANCQGGIGLLPFFRGVWPNTKFYHNYIENEIPPDEELYECELFVYQHSKFSEDIVKKLKPECTIVSFPYLYDDGTFSVHNGTSGFVIIDNLLDEGKDVLKMFDEGTIDFDLDNRRKRSIEILKRKEEMCTITISDYIEKMRHVPLFFNHNHPTMFLVLELINRIFRHLGLGVIESDIIGWNIGTHLDQFGFCKFPMSKEKSIEDGSMMNLDKYSRKRQVKCFHGYSGDLENFYIVDDAITRLRIANYIQKKKDESSKSTVCTSLPETEPGA